MEIFETLLAETPKKISYNARKLFLPESGDFLLYGAPKSGKTSLVLLFASQKKRPFLYVDMQDLRLEPFMANEAYKFAVSKNISTLILDGFTGDSPPKGDENIQVALITRERFEFEDFESLKLFGVDFEEYLSLYENKRQARDDEEGVAHIFADFLKNGSLPKISELTEFDKRIYRRSRIKEAANSATEELVYVEFLRRVSMKFSLLQVFESLKSKTKISKDLFYSYSKRLEDMGALFFVEKFCQKNSPKKIYAYDFSLKSAVDFKKDFSGVFENMVFLELASRGYEIYYVDDAGLLLPVTQKCVVSKPFFTLGDEKLISKISKKLRELGLNEADIVTINAEEESVINGIKIRAIPFWRWALGL